MVAPRISNVEASDAELVQRYREGDERAFAEIYRRYARYIASIAYHTMGANEHVDDIVQDTFVSASTGLSKLDAASKLKSWLGTVAVRTARARIRHIARGRTLRQRLRDMRETLSNQASAPSSGQEISKEIEALPEKLRLPWVLQRIAGYEIDEVAELCEVSSATVKRRVAAAEERLRKALVEHG